MIKAIVFDFDGLIYDTEAPEYRAYREIFAEHGHELELAVWGQCVGTHDSGFDPYGHLEACLGRTVDRELLRARHREKFEALLAAETIRPGVEDYLKDAGTLGLRVGLASSATRAWVTGHLGRLSVAPYFECIRVRDDVVRAKPDPELYLQVLREFGLEPHEAVAFEDSPNGAKAAKAAGMYCVTVPNDVTRELAFGSVDLRLESLADVRLDALIRRLEAASPVR
ncbi:haloacid dehalogenase superfamily, subfamily IA, variant 3 with third motif having DD or ED [Paenibacillus sp. UNC496MF]|uniref:HAD family hydrolase n=1 Tax=Paenibacillus sp. UNC496MF TaxID=1502753 RepID=UPI0008E775EF|nr:HAD-IA family hydrolase [Paenibacillus sp. UNC496MF]SFJ22457.1 haloacid dehalogenase superfamily, subfamily IA, variant 3 with third motif having DD or ED [Paenibacillus sp. UNC496MF]